MSKKIRVLHYVSGFAETSGGIESFLLNAFKAFDNDSHVEYSLLTRFAYTTSEFYKVFTSAGYSVHSLGIQHLGVTKYVEFHKRVQDFFRENHFDVLHAHGTDEPVIIRCAQEAGIQKIILHIHTPGMEMDGRKSWMRRIKLLWRKQNIRRADLFCGCSEYVVRSAIPNAAKESTHVINNCIETECYRYRAKTRERFRNQWGVTPQERVIGHVGRFAQVKNQTFLLEILRAAKDAEKNWKLVLIGNGPDFSAVQKKANELNLADSVIFMGERTDVPDILSAMDVFVFPSVFEGLAMTVIEAQASGVPCVVSTAVPEEAVVTDLVQRLALNLGSDGWIDTIDRVTPPSDREIYAQQTADAGFGLMEINRSLKPIYRRCIHEQSD